MTVARPYAATQRSSEATTLTPCRSTMVGLQRYGLAALFPSPRTGDRQGQRQGTLRGEKWREERERRGSWEEYSTP